MKRITSIAAAVLTAAFMTTARTASAQDSNIDQLTYLTFSGAVQMPGVTLPAGKYEFKLADTALHNVMQVFDGDGFVTGADFDQFVIAFEAGDMRSDFDGDGFITGIDFDQFVAAFEAGC